MDGCSVVILFLVSHPCLVNNGGCDQLCIPLWKDGQGYAQCQCVAGYQYTYKEGECRGKNITP